MARALITGPTAGIGRAFARLLATKGYDLVLVARDAERLQRLADDVSGTAGIDVEVIVADLSDRARLETVADRLADADRPVDVLVNNAGFGVNGTLWETDPAAELAQLDVLVGAVLRLSQAHVIALRKRRGQLPKPAGIINVSSVSAFMYRGSYSSHKAWANNFSTGLHQSLGPLGITVTALCPGFVRTEFHQRMDLDMSSMPGFMWLDADDLVRDAWSDFTAGKTISVPSRRYRAIRAALRATPASVIGFLGRVYGARH